jgi:hypothetical protein
MLTAITVVPEVPPVRMTGGEGHDVDVDGATQTVPVRPWTCGVIQGSVKRNTEKSNKGSRYSFFIMTLCFSVGQSTTPLKELSKSWATERYRGI